VTAARRLAAGFEEQHLMAAVLGQTIGKRGAGRACTDDDKVGRADVHAFPPAAGSLFSGSRI